MNKKKFDFKDSLLFWALVGSLIGLAAGLYTGDLQNALAAGFIIGLGVAGIFKSGHKKAKK